MNMRAYSCVCVRAIDRVTEDPADRWGLQLGLSVTHTVVVVFLMQLYSPVIICLNL